MYMAAKLSLKDPNGSPASGAILTMNNQQVVANEQGVAWFSDVMHHTQEVTVFYNGQNYTVPVHFHTPEQYAWLGMSHEFKNTGTAFSLALAGLILALGLYVRFGRELPRIRREWHFILKSTRIQHRVLSAATLGFMVASLIALSLSFGPFVNQAEAAVNQNLPVPTGLKIVEDDRNAILEWNGGVSNMEIEDPEGVSGYQVSWGLEGQPLGNKKLVTERITQLQPLENGKKYVVQIQAVDNLGRVSPPSNALTFTGNPARVDMLRAKMNGFFDDFNLPAGGYDELKWNSAYSRCTVPEYSAFFINTQFHSHNLLSALNCDRAQAISRPRAVFDFTNRTGTITFDFDGNFRRDTWYLDIVPELMDITGRINDDSAGHPGNFVRLQQREQGLNIQYIDKNGIPKILSETDWNNFVPLDYAGVKLTPNVRRQWEVKLSQNYVGIFINGKKVLETGELKLDFSRAHLLWSEFAYNNPKANEPFVLVHWDNFGFDAPDGYKPATRTHNYRLNNSGADFFNADSSTKVTRTLRIPDQVKGTLAERLMFTLQMDSNGAYQWSQNDHVVINGKRFDVAQPKSNVPNLSIEEIVSGYVPHSMVLQVPSGTFKTGDNTLEFSLENSGVLNVHAELDFEINKAPNYTQPFKLEALAPIPPTPDVGPGALIKTIAGKEIAEENLPNAEKQIPLGKVLSGKTKISIEVTGDVAMNATGSNPGISRLELYLNKKLVWQQDTTAGAPAPKVNMDIELETAGYPDGTYELFLRAVNPNGTFSFPDYPAADPFTNQYYPVLVEIKNGKTGGQIVPISGSKDYVVAPTPTPLPSQLESADPTPVPDGQQEATQTEVTPVVTTQPAKPAATPIAAGQQKPAGNIPESSPANSDKLPVPVIAALTLGGVLLLSGIFLLSRVSAKSKTKAKKLSGK
jgi:hypothetical protein